MKIREAQPSPSRANAIAVYNGLLLAAAVGVTAVGVELGGWGRVEWPAAVTFLGLVTAAEYLIVRFRYRNELEGLNLFEAVLAPLIFGSPIIVVVAVVAAGQAVAGLLRRNPPVKSMFNVAQWSLAAGCGSLLYGALRRGSPLTTHNAAALILALTAVAVVNQVAFTNVIRLAQGQTVREVLRSRAPVFLRGIGVGWLVNTTFGLLFVTTFAWNALASAAFFVPLVALHWAYRGYATALADQVRLEGMRRATRALMTPLDPREAIPHFLREVRSCFEAEAADLLLLDGPKRIVYRLRPGRPDSYSVVSEDAGAQSLATALMERERPVRVTSAHTDLALASLLRREGWRDCIGAPLFDGDHVAGILCTYNRVGLEGFEDGEIAILEALARDAAGAVQKGRLLEAVLDERRKLSDIVTQTSDGILTLDSEGTVVSWNPALERISGYAAAEMLGTKSICLLRPRDSEGADVMIERWAGAEIALPSAVQVIARSGETRWLSCSYSRVEPDDDPGLLIVVARDATQAHELERLKDDFVATVSHELRTPLTPLKAWASTLLNLGDRLDPEQRREGIATMLRQTERLERLVTNLLEVSRIERGFGDNQSGVVDARTAVAKVVQDFAEANPERTIRLEAPRSGCAVRGDELWLEQIISNLLSNAVKYSPATEPIHVRVTKRPGELEVAVADRGPGIPAHQADRIFNRFERLGDPLTKSREGTGLGLYIARQLAHAIGATLTVDSRPGEGATFLLKLRPVGNLAAVG